MKFEMPFILFFTLILCYSCEEKNTERDPIIIPDDFLEGTILAPLSDNSEFEKFVFALKKSEEYAKSKYKVSMIDLLSGNDSEEARKYTVYVPTDSSLDVLFRWGNFFDQNISFYHSYVQRHIASGKVEVNGIPNVWLFIPTVRYLGNDSLIIGDYYPVFEAQGVAYTANGGFVPDAICTEEGAYYISSSKGYVHVIEGDFMEKELEHYYFLDGIYFIESVEITGFNPLNFKDVYFDFSRFGSFSEKNYEELLVNNLLNNIPLEDYDKYEYNPTSRILNLRDDYKNSVEMKVVKSYDNQLILTYEAPYPEVTSATEKITLNLRRKN